MGCKTDGDNANGNTSGAGGSTVALPDILANVAKNRHDFKHVIQEFIAGVPEPFDCMTVAQAFNKKYETRIDWHEFSIALDCIDTEGIIKVVRPGGFVGYAFNNKHHNLD